MDRRLHEDRFSGDRSEGRQLFALDTRADANAPLVFMPEGGADALRERTRAGELICPVPGCAQPAYVARGGTTRRHHFAHRPGAGGHAPESYFHLVAKRTLADWVRRRYPQMQVVLEQRVESGQIADVLITSPRTEARMALEVQFSPLSVEEWARRSAGYEDYGVRVQWIFGHLPPHLRRADAAGTYQLGELHRAALRDDAPMFFINPDLGLIGRMMDASLWEALDGTGRRGTLPHPELDGRLLVYPLDDCRLSPNGLAPPDADSIADAILRQRERRARHERDAAREWEARQRARQRRAQRQERMERGRTIAPPERSDTVRREMAVRYERARPALVRRAGEPPVEALAPSRLDERIWMDPAHWKHALWAKMSEGPRPFRRRELFRLAAKMNRAAPGALDADHRTVWAWDALAWWLWGLRATAIATFRGEIGAHVPIVESDVTLMPTWIADTIRQAGHSRADEDHAVRDQAEPDRHLMPPGGP